MFRLEQLFQQLLRERTYINNVTVSTREWYECAWNAFTAAQKDAPDRNGTDALIRKTDLQPFIVHLRERGVKPVTCNTWLRAMNAFYRWLHDQDELPAPVKLNRNGWRSGSSERARRAQGHRDLSPEDVRVSRASPRPMAVLDAASSISRITRTSPYILDFSPPRCFPYALAGAHQ